LLVAADEVTAAGEELEIENCVDDAQDHQDELGPEEKGAMVEDGVGEPIEKAASGGGGFGPLAHDAKPKQVSR
jgi:hypothetical protein